MPAKISRPSGDTPTRSSSVAKSNTVAALVHRCRVVTVNTRDYSVDVRAENTPYQTFFDLPFMVPYCNQVQGEGINFMPEVGATCWVCETSSDGQTPFILGWTMVSESGSYRGGRELLNPGDLHFSTRDGNFVAIRRGGVVQIGATPICQRVYLPIRNFIQDYAENYQLSTPGGDLTWLVSRAETDGTGKQGTLWQLSAKEFSDDPNTNPVALLKIGSHGQGDPTILTLDTRASGGGAIQTSLKIDKAGNISWRVQQNLTLTIIGNMLETITGNRVSNVTGNISRTAGGNITDLATALMTLGGGGGSGGQLVLGPSGGAFSGGAGLTLDSGAVLAVLRNSPDLVAWMAAVTAALAGATAGVPVVTLGPGTLPLPTQHINPRIRA